MAQATGTVVVRVNGKSILSKPGAKLKPGGPKRTGQMADGNAGLHFTEEQMPAVITMDTLHTSDFSVDEMRAWNGVTCTFECDSGVTYQVSPAYQSGEPEISGPDGVTGLEFTGPPATQI